MKNLNKEFVNAVLEEIKLIIGSNADVQCHEVLKNNGVKLHGITIFMSEENVSPTIYIEEFANKNMSVRDIAKTIIIELAGARNLTPNVKPEDITDFNNVKSRICCKLINKENNKEMLQNIPYTTFYDLAVILIIDFGKDDDARMSVKVTNKILSLWNKTFDELYQLAMENTERMFPAKFRDMAEIMAEISGMPVEMFQGNDMSMYVLTNESGINGATCLLYPNVLGNIAAIMESDFVILPSSLHEVIIQPILPEITVDDLNEIITEINQKEVADEDVLSDHAYIYRRETGNIEF